MRWNRLSHGFTPASLRCLCAMDPESLGKALQDCLRALGTGQDANPPAAPAPQAVAGIEAGKKVLRGEWSDACPPEPTHDDTRGDTLHPRLIDKFHKQRGFDALASVLRGLVALPSFQRCLERLKNTQVQRFEHISQVAGERHKVHS